MAAKRTKGSASTMAPRSMTDAVEAHVLRDGPSDDPVVDRFDLLLAVIADRRDQAVALAGRPGLVAAAERADLLALVDRLWGAFEPREPTPVELREWLIQLLRIEARLVRAGRALDACLDEIPRYVEAWWPDVGKDLAHPRARAAVAAFLRGARPGPKGSGELTADELLDRVLRLVSVDGSTEAAKKSKKRKRPDAFERVLGAAAVKR